MTYILASSRIQRAQERVSAEAAHSPAAGPMASCLGGGVQPRPQHDRAGPSHYSPWGSIRCAAPRTKGAAVAGKRPWRLLEHPLSQGAGIEISVGELHEGDKCAWLRQAGDEMEKNCGDPFPPKRGSPGDGQTRRAQRFDSRGSGPGALAVWLRPSRVRCSGAAF